MTRARSVFATVVFVLACQPTTPDRNNLAGRYYLECKSEKPVRTRAVMLLSSDSTAAIESYDRGGQGIYSVMGDTVHVYLSPGSGSDTRHLMFRVCPGGLCEYRWVRELSPEEERVLLADLLDGQRRIAWPNPLNTRDSQEAERLAESIIQPIREYARLPIPTGCAPWRRAE